jgi:hypothetical protein
MAQHDARIAKPQLRQGVMEKILRTLDARESLYALARLRPRPGADCVLSEFLPVL